MKRIVFVICAIISLAGTLTINAQTQMDPPSIIVVPDNIYCNKHGYMQKDNTPDYEKALLNDQNMKNVIEQVRSLIQERNKGFEMPNLMDVINHTKENQMLALENNAAEESFADRILRNTAADVMLSVDFNIDYNGPQKIMHITLDARDAYTGNSIALVEGVTSPSTASAASTLAREAVYNKIDALLNSLLATYQSWIEKGRPIKVDIQATNGGSMNLNTTVGDGMVYEHVEDFLHDNAKNDRGVTGSGSSTLRSYRGVYFPMQMKGRRGRIVKLSASNVASQLQSYLETQGIKSNCTAIGLGRIIVYIQ